MGGSDLWSNTLPLDHGDALDKWSENICQDFIIESEALSFREYHLMRIRGML